MFPQPCPQNPGKGPRLICCKCKRLAGLGGCPQISCLLTFSPLARRATQPSAKSATVMPVGDGASL